MNIFDRLHNLKTGQKDLIAVIAIIILMILAGFVDSINI